LDANFLFGFEMMSLGAGCFQNHKKQVCVALKSTSALHHLLGMTLAKVVKMSSSNNNGGVKNSTPHTLW